MKILIKKKGRERNKKRKNYPFSKKARDKEESGRRKKYSDLAGEFKILIFTIFFANSSYVVKREEFFPHRNKLKNGLFYWQSRVEFNPVLRHIKFLREQYFFIFSPFSPLNCKLVFFLCLP